MNKTIEALKRVEVWVESLTGLHTDVRQEQGEILAAIREALAEPDWYEEAMRLGGLNAKHVGELKQLIAEPVKQEPVAYVYDREIAGIGYRKDVAFIKNVEVGTDLYAAPLDAKAIRAEALEEAAKVCESKELRGIIAGMCAAAIRGLK